MFDDQLPQQGNAPGNLPIGEPEDMFAATEPVPAAPAETAPATNPQDMAPAMPPAQTTDQPQIQETRTASMEQNAPASLPTAMSAGKLQPKDGGAQMEQNSPAQDIPLAAPLTVPGQPSQMNTPAPNQMPHISTMPQEMQPGADMMSGDSMKEPRIGRTVITILIALIVAAVIGGGVWFALAYFFSTPETIENTTPTVVESPTLTDVAPTPAPVPPTAEATTTTTIPAAIPLPVVDTSTDMGADAALDMEQEQVLFGDIIDTDEDQLDDERELEFGTDPRNWDTDGDDLGDGEEVLNWGTDPLDPDTDGDGFSDGQEVASGYNPTLGGGAKLFETTISTTTP